MEKNRFEKCNSLVTIYKVMNTPGVTYESLTEESKATLYRVYIESKGPGAILIKYPLTKEGYAHILEQVTVIYNALCSEAEKLKGDKKHGKIHQAVDAVYQTAANAVSSTIVRAGSDANEFKETCDANITNIKNSLGNVLSLLDGLSGASRLKNLIMSIIYRNTEGTKTRRGFFDAAEEARQAVESYLRTLGRLDPSKVDFKTVVALRYMLGQDEEGNPTGRRSVFEAFANGIVWICKKVVRKLRSWFGVDEESNIFGSVGAAIASVFGVACGVIKDVLTVAMHFVILVGSYVLSALLNAISWVVEKISGWVDKVKSKFTIVDEEEDEADNVELAA